MDLQFESVLGRRAVATEGSAFVTLETTQGNFKMGSIVSDQIGVADGDALVVASPDGGKTYFVAKGRNGVAELDAEGNELKDERGRAVYDKGNEPFGATVRNINEGGAYQRFAASAAWAALGGNNDTKKVYELGEGVDANVPAPDGTSHSCTLYPLVFVKDEEKIVRTKKEATDALADTVADTVADTNGTEGFVAPQSDFQDEEL